MSFAGLLHALATSHSHWISPVEGFCTDSNILVSVRNYCRCTVSCKINIAGLNTFCFLVAAFQSVDQFLIERVDRHHLTYETDGLALLFFAADYGFGFVVFAVEKNGLIAEYFVGSFAGLEFFCHA